MRCQAPAASRPHSPWPARLTHKPPAAVLSQGRDRRSRQLCLDDRALSRQVDQSPGRADPQPVIARHQEGADIITGQALGGGPDTAAVAIRCAARQPTRFDPEPKRAVGCLGQRAHPPGRQTVLRLPLPIVTAGAAVGAEPDGAVGGRQYCQNVRRRQRLLKGLPEFVRTAGGVRTRQGMWTGPARPTGPRKHTHAKDA